MPETPHVQVHVAVDRDRCKAVQMCRYSAPGAFQPDSEMVATFQPDGDWTLEQVRDAVENCPNETLTLFIDGVEQS